MHNRYSFSNQLVCRYRRPNKVRYGREYIIILRKKLHGFGKRIQLWNQRRKQRRELYALSDAILKDIGVSRVDALQEAEKPFWQP